MSGHGTQPSGFAKALQMIPMCFSTGVSCPPGDLYENAHSQVPQLLNQGPGELCLQLSS